MIQIQFWSISSYGVSDPWHKELDILFSSREEGVLPWGKSILIELAATQLLSGERQSDAHHCSFNCRLSTCLMKDRMTWCPLHFFLALICLRYLHNSHFQSCDGSYTWESYLVVLYPLHWFQIVPSSSTRTRKWYIYA